MGKWYGEVDKNRKQLMVDRYIVDGSTCKPSTRKSATSNHPAYALFLLAGTLLLLALAFLPQLALAATPITNCTELQNIRNNLSGDYYLANDIDCSCTSGWNGGAGFKPIGNRSSEFNGTFDGQGYKITYLHTNRASTNDVGLFGWAGSGSEIKNVGLEEVNVSGFYAVGSLVGSNNGTITNSYSSGSVSGSLKVGGLVGFNYGGTITNSYSSGSVNGSQWVGGLAGRNNGTIANSYSSDSVSGYSKYVGGLVGCNYGGTTTNSYSSGSVSGSSFVGGLVGCNYIGTIANSYSSGNVSGYSDYVGGLTGYNKKGTITNSYWDIFRSNQSNCVGAGSSSGCTGKNAANSEPDYWYYSAHAPMDQWDFNAIWGIVEGVTYPYLQWQYAHAPDITSFAPPSPVNDTVCTWRTFNVTVNQTVNVSWYLNKSLQFKNQHRLHLFQRQVQLKIFSECGFLTLNLLIGKRRFRY